MGTAIHQGDVLKIDNVRYPVLVVSTDFFNATSFIIGCPIIENRVTDSPLHIEINTKKSVGCVMCEDVKKFDMHVRRYSIADRVSMDAIINITDAIQSIFDYIC